MLIVEHYHSIDFAFEVNLTYNSLRTVWTQDILSFLSALLIFFNLHPFLYFGNLDTKAFNFYICNSFLQHLIGILALMIPCND